ncbi:FAD-dependent oxidoreductase [Streptomyces sp. LX-29]|uniref:NAD(P)/FAD-dependent oxidoreductase n=1 Tax=Streptomyces sp. LX-29 TaxID=2900152 RepID=UPI00240D1632|nr:FAD-dependent oxidoreductase [Streptomyces sp. LX-29]WFB08101.1 FAD-dependent oxidoreductase [Streptomyces sp. LX-29]
MNRGNARHGDAQRRQIVVLGAGYAGLMAALRLAPHDDVTLVDPSDRFTERVRLHELAAAGTDVTRPLSGFLAGTSVTHIAARAVGIDTAARAVRTDDGRTLPYDRLVYALGSRTGTEGGVLGAGDRAYTVETGAELRKRLLDGPGSVAVVGGGLTGVELAGEIAESAPGWQVRLLTAGEVGTGLSEKGRAHVRAALGGLGVRVEEGLRVAGADDVDADVVVWAAAMTANSALAASAGLALDPTGRIRVDDALRSVSHPEISVAGDAAAAGSPLAGPLRMGCATALPTGSHVASVLLAEARGEAPKPLGFRYIIQCLSLGRRDGLIQFVRADDSPRERALTGRAAAFAKERVVRQTVANLRLAANRPSLVPLLPAMS